MKISRRNLLIHTNFQYMISVSLFLLLQKGIYPYKYMIDWEKFNEKSLPEIENFYSHLNMEDIDDAVYTHAKRVCKDFEIKNLHVQSDALLLADVFENFQNMCLEIYELDPACFFTAS